jgi:hypothetical protein
MSPLTPEQFEQDQAWIAFRLNDLPIETEEDGNFNVIGLMDASSLFLLTAEFIPQSASEASEEEAERLLSGGYSRAGKLPGSLYIPSNEKADRIVAVAESQGICVVRSPESELIGLIGEARSSFRERFSGGGVQ